MRRWCTIAALVISIPLFAQQVSTIEPDNPIPRVGDHLTLSVTLRKNTAPEDAAKSINDEQIILDNTVSTGSLKFVQVTKDTGQITIGPLAITVKGVTYEAESVSIRVRPALPAAVAEGVWLSVARFNTYIYVIVEQRIPNQVKRDDQNTLRLDVGNVIFAELITEKLENAGLEFISMSVNTANQSIPANAGSRNSAYKMTAYKFQPTSNFKGKLKVDRAFFINMPKGAKLDDILIDM